MMNHKTIKHIAEIVAFAIPTSISATPPEIKPGSDDKGLLDFQIEEIKTIRQIVTPLGLQAELIRMEKQLIAFNGGGINNPMLWSDYYKKINETTDGQKLPSKFAKIAGADLGKLEKSNATWKAIDDFSKVQRKAIDFIPGAIPAAILLKKNVEDFMQRNGFPTSSKKSKKSLRPKDPSGILASSTSPATPPAEALREKHKRVFLSLENVEALSAKTDSESLESFSLGSNIKGEKELIQKIFDPIAELSVEMFNLEMENLCTFYLKLIEDKFASTDETSLMEGFQAYNHLVFWLAYSLPMLQKFSEISHDPKSIEFFKQSYRSNLSKVRNFEQHIIIVTDRKSAIELLQHSVAEFVKIYYKTLAYKYRI